MKKLLFALLTTLLVNAMPLQAAYAQADDANKVENQQDKQACQTYAELISDNLREQIKINGGTIVELEGTRAAAFQARAEELFGSPAPFSTSRVVIVNPDGQSDTILNIGLFDKEGCLKAFLQLPPQVVDALSSPLEKKPGERVD